MRLETSQGRIKSDAALRVQNEAKGKQRGSVASPNYKGVGRGHIRFDADAAVDMSTLRTDIAIALSWGTLHRWFGVAPLAKPHYAEINRHWVQAWHHAGEKRPVPTVDLYHGADKLRWCEKPRLTIHQPSNYGFLAPPIWILTADHCKRRQPT
jgi:hypothetical protein